jgi:phospho-N-acetylmuramoyl-pentapeptide-transferase
MGGILFTGATAFSALLWADITSPYVLISVFGMLLFAAIGIADDYLKIRKGRSMGLSAAQKFVAQALLALSLGVYLLHFSEITGFAKEIFLPFVKGAIFSNSAWFYLFFIILVITGTSNAVNLTDGLDGLAIGCTVICSLALSVICYVVGNRVFCDYLYLEYIRQSAELSVFCAAMVGAGLGFMWWNAHPAEVFMGDTGALSIGGALGIVSVLIKKELYLVLIGGVFVLEALSVIVQVASFKIRGKRVFLCAPFHHHLELKGWKESKITVRLWILAVIFALLGLCSLKFR